jgi:hypothetical protein
MSGFIQFVEFEATDVDALAAELRRFQEEHPGVLTATASTSPKTAIDPAHTYRSLSSHRMRRRWNNRPIPRPRSSRRTWPPS